MQEQKRHPTPTALRKALKSGRPVPEWAADYICDRLEKRLSLPRGKQKWSVVGLNTGEVTALVPGFFAPHTRALLRYRHVMKVRQWERILKHPRYAREYSRRHRGRLYIIAGAYREALWKWSEKTGIPVDTLDTYVYPRGKKKRSTGT